MAPGNASSIRLMIPRLPSGMRWLGVGGLAAGSVAGDRLASHCCM
jgi:hypothetical protein